MARGPTAEEFRDFIKECIAEWRRRGGQGAPIFSWDNPKIHGSVEAGDWADLGITMDTHTQLPPYSPDMHSVIETSHAVLMAHMQQYINDRNSNDDDTTATYIEALKENFHKCLSPRWAARATRRLFVKVLPAILKAQGQYPPKKLR